MAGYSVEDFSRLNSRMSNQVDWFPALAINLWGKPNATSSLIKATDKFETFADAFRFEKVDGAWPNQRIVRREYQELQRHIEYSRAKGPTRSGGLIVTGHPGIGVLNLSRALDQ